MKKLIMGFGTNQNEASLAVFMRSARAVWSRDEADIVLLTNNGSQARAFATEVGAQLISTTNTWHPSTSALAKAIGQLYLRSLGLICRTPFDNNRHLQNGYNAQLETWHHPQLGRWFAYSRILEFLNGYSHVLISDTKDVVFQDDLFERTAQDKVTVFEDGEVFTPESWNGRWYIGAYGRASYEKVRDRQPICIGVMVGEVNALRRVVLKFANEIAKSPFGKIEQAIFNKMLFLNAFGDDVEVKPNGSPVATLARPEDTSDLEIENGLIRGKEGHLIPVVHMYDRFPHMQAACVARYSAALQP